MEKHNVKLRGVGDSNTKPRKERKGYDPLVTKSSFKIPRKPIYEQTCIYDYSEHKRKPVLVTLKKYNMNPFFVCSIELFNICSELSKPAMKVLTYIIDKININSNFIELKAKSIMDYTKIKSTPSIYTAIKELCDKDIIHKASEKNNSTYDININLFFKGRRSDFINNYIEMNEDDIIDGGCIVSYDETL